MRFLFCWEFGENLGHVMLIRSIAKELISQGHDVTAAIKDTRYALEYLSDLGVTWIQAPISHHRSNPDYIGCHADILLSRGYDCPTNLAGMMGAWSSLIKLSCADRIICESAPTAALVSRSMGMPVLALDTGFFMPPAHSPVPGFSISGSDYLKMKEDQAITSINKALNLMGFSSIPNFASLFDTPCLWLTWPEINHFGVHNEKFHIGPIGRGADNGATHEFLNNGSLRVFAYLRDRKAESVIALKNLLINGAEVLAYLPGWSSDDARDLMVFPGFRLSHKAVNIEAMADNIDLLVGHAALGSVSTLLMRGVPSLMLPAQKEQEIFAKAVAKEGLGILFDSTLTVSQSAISNIIKNAKLFSGSKRNLRNSMDVLIENLLAK